MEKQSIVFIVVALVIGFALGLLLVLSLYPSSLTNKDVEIRKQFVSELREKGTLPPEPETIIDVYGKVKNLSDKAISLVLEERFDDPLQEFLPKIVTINIDEDTEIFQLKKKPFEVFDKEQQEFDRKMEQYEEEAPTDLTPPDPFTKEEIGLSDIKQGDVLTAFSNTNLKGQSEFTAVSIQVEQIEELPAE